MSSVMIHRAPSALNALLSSFSYYTMYGFCILRFVSTREAYDRIFFNDVFMMYSCQAICFSLNACVACAGAIPSELGGLSALVNLNLNGNQLSGEYVRGFCVFVRLFVRRSKQSILK